MNPEIELSQHVREMLAERNIPEAWLWLTLTEPDDRQTREDHNAHYLRAIEEYEGRVLRVIVNETVQPNRVATVFFDRRLRG